MIGHNITVLALALILGVPGSTRPQEGCLECHGEADLTRVNEAGVELSLFVDSTAYAASVHGDVSCVDCHTDAEPVPHEARLMRVDCGLCHGDAEAAYQASIHAEAWNQGHPEAPTCAACHGKHDIRAASDPSSRVHPLQLAHTCASCHADPQLVQKFAIPIADPLTAYRQSVHGVAILSERNFEAATCASCHGAHDIRALSDPEARIFWKNVPNTCGACHADVLQEYAASIHWRAAYRL